MRYTTKPRTIKINDFSYSFSPSDYRFLNLYNSNLVSIDEIKNTENVGEQINVINYLGFNTGYYLGTISGMDGFIYSHIEGSENISPIIYNKSNKKLSKGEIVISRNATLGKASYINNDINCILNGGLSNIFIENIIKRFYIFGFFINSFLKEQLILKTSAGGTQQNAKRSNVLELKIPFPTKNNNKKPEDIELLISYITQNIIDKEEQIKEKNNLINQLIEKELNENQKGGKEEVYSFPRLNDFFYEGRIDTGLYKEGHKKLYNKILNYKNGYYFIGDKLLLGGNTPKNRFFEPTIKRFLWFTPTDINSGVLSSKKYIKAEKYNLGKKFALLFSNRSNCGEGILYSPEYFKGGHHNQGIYRKEFDKKDLIDNLFILNLFNSNFYQNLIKNIATGSTFPELRIETFLNIPLPNFSKEKQEEISNLYYFDIEKNKEINLNNYLEKEFERNKKIGIFQLNMEIFSLREKLDFFIDKIIKDENIEIDLKY